MTHAAEADRFSERRREAARERQQLADERRVIHVLYPPRPLEGLGTNVNAPRTVPAAGEQTNERTSR